MGGTVASHLENRQGSFAVSAGGTPPNLEAGSPRRGDHGRESVRPSKMLVTFALHLSACVGLERGGRRDADRCDRDGTETVALPRFRIETTEAQRHRDTKKTDEPKGGTTRQSPPL